MENGVTKTGKVINNKTIFKEIYDYISQIMIFFNKFYKNNKTNNNLLLKEDIKKLTSFIRSDSSIGNIVRISNFFQSFTCNVNIENENVDIDGRCQKNLWKKKISIVPLIALIQMREK